MLSLAIECSGMHGSVALFNRDLQLGFRKLPETRSSVECLASSIVELSNEVSAQEIKFLSVTHGPGSFTGLRVGLATAQMLSLAWSIPTVCVDSLEAVALRATQKLARADAAFPPMASPATVIAVMNAFRKQVFASVWQATEPTGLRRMTKTQVLDAAVWQAEPLLALSADGQYERFCNVGTSAERFDSVEPSVGETLALQGQSEAASVLVTGPGLTAYCPEVRSGLQLAAQESWNPTATQVGQLGWAAFQAGKAVDAAKIKPNYVRMAAAQEKLR